MEWRDSQIVRVVDETPLDRTLFLEVPAGCDHWLDFRPGQFVVMSDPEAATPVRRAYSLSSAPREHAHLCITVRRMGGFGCVLHGFGPGKGIRLEPPQGRFVLAEDDAPLLLCAGGSGITPFRSFVVHLARQGRRAPVGLLQSAQQPEELLFHPLFEALTREAPWLAYEPTVTRAAPEHPWPGRRGRIDADRIRARLGDPAATWFYACGPGAFVREMLELAAALGVPRERCRKEQWG